MELKDAVKLALIYRKITPDMFKAYTELVERTAEHFNINDAKSIRFENDRKKLMSVRNKNSSYITTPNPLDSNSDVEVVCYAIAIRNKGDVSTIEKGHRYMFCSDKFTDAFSVRVFDQEKKFDNFKRLNHITIVNEFTFRGANFVLYKSKESNVDRVAIFCDKECDLTPEALASEVSYNVNLGTSAKTSVFG